MTRSKKPSPPARASAKAARLPEPARAGRAPATGKKRPKVLRYPRDPSLDPQLVWKGKDEQDAQDLAVPARPIHVQEMIHPRVMVENLRARQATGDLDLFADPDAVADQATLDVYRHAPDWSNRMILGDSLLVMASLAEREGLKGRVQMIYLDPPYGIKFGSNWQVSTRKRDVQDGRAEDVTRQPEQVKAFRDTWQLGIHSYLSCLRDRLVVARELLAESGSLFVQMGDENVHLVRCLLDEVFGSENFKAHIFVAKTSGFGETTSLASVGDHVLWYARSAPDCQYRQLYQSKADDSAFAREYRFVEGPDGEVRRLPGRSKSPEAGTTGRRFRYSTTTSQGATPAGGFDFEFDGQTFRVPPGQHWKTSADGMRRLARAGRLAKRDRSLSYIRYLEDFPLVPQTNNWVDLRWGFDARDKRYVVETNPGIVERCLLMTTDPGDLVLDPTCGSGTTAYVAEQWGRRWITMDTSRVAIALARTRLMAARFPYYVLAEEYDDGRPTTDDLGPRSSVLGPTRGFIYKRVPHITLRSIANDEALDAIHAKWQARLEPLRAALHQALGTNWEAWEVPRDLEKATREAPRNLKSEISHLHSEWWRLRRERQAEIDARIARRADAELLYDQPLVDGRRVRVAGPFTVESLSPHRALTAEAGRAESTIGFEQLIVQNLKAAGVQNTVKKERLRFDRLEPFAGTWLQAAGEYTRSGQTRRVAVCIGPEHGTVGAELVRQAAAEASQGKGFDLLVVCGFAFDAAAGEVAASPPEGRLRGRRPTIVLARMNPDLSMGDELLKKTGAANLFTVFGEPDVEVQQAADGRLTVAVHGVDVYDPTTGEVRSSSTDDIACWFVDDEYDGECFFVRHAYFTGAGEPYEKLKRALRAEIDEAAWSALYSTVSAPFDPPRTGRIAVKVINHYGDEVLKVYRV